MPMYTYQCDQCGFVFEDLVSFDEKDTDITCSLCAGKAVRNAVETFGIHTTLNSRTDTIYSPKEIDKVVGAESERKWAGYDERWRKKYEAQQQARWKGKQPTPVNIPKDADGKYSPLMHLGDPKERDVRKGFSKVLQEHRADRKSKGLDQFDGPGAITE